MKAKALERGMEIVFFIAACMAILAVALICVFIFAYGIPAIREIGVAEFLAGRKWTPTDTPASFGIFTMMLGSLYITAGGNSCRRAYRPAFRHLYGTFLPEKNIPVFKARR